MYKRVFLRSLNNPVGALEILMHNKYLKIFIPLECPLKRHRCDDRPSVSDYSIIIRSTPIFGLKGYIQIEDYTDSILHKLHIKIKNI